MERCLAGEAVVRKGSDVAGLLSGGLASEAALHDSSNRFETKRCVVAAEAKGVVKSNSYVFLASNVWDVVQVALRVGIIEIDRGRYHAMFHGQDADRAFHCSSAAEEMPNHRFR